MMAIAQVMLGQQASGLGAAMASGLTSAKAAVSEAPTAPAARAAPARPTAELRTAADELDSDDEEAPAAPHPTSSLRPPPPRDETSRDETSRDETPRDETRPPAIDPEVGHASDDVQARSARGKVATGEAAAGEALYTLQQESGTLSVAVRLPPDVSSMAQVELELSSSLMRVHVDARPYLELVLPSSIDDETATAKFARKVAELRVTAQLSVA